MILGYSANNYAALDKLVTGGKPPIREYSQMDHIAPDYAALAAGGRQLCVSIKPKLNNPATIGGTAFKSGIIPIGALIPAAGKTTTVFDPNILAHAEAAAALPKPTLLGKHIVVNWHEGDVGTLNGTPAQICTAIQHMNSVSRSAPGFSDVAEIGVIIGDYNFALIQQFKAALLDPDIVLVDQPYIPAGVSPGGVKAFMDQRFNAMRAMGVKRFGIGEFGVRNGIPNRAAALAECLAWMDAQDDLEVVYYWDAPDVSISNSPEQAAYMGAVQAHLLTPDQVTIAKLTEENKALKAAIDQADAILHPLA